MVAPLIAVAVTDNFGSDSDPLASPWATVGSLGTLRAVSGAVATSMSGGVDSAMRYSTSTELCSQVTVTTVGGRDGGPAINLTSGGVGYFVTNGSGSHLNMYELPAFEDKDVTPGAVTLQVGDDVKICREGNDIAAYVNEVEMTRGTDTTSTAGNPGIFMFDDAVRFDDWTDLAGGGGSVIPQIMNHRRQMAQQ